MKKPKIDEKLTLLTDFGETEAICAEVLDNPATEEGVLLKVMARGPFEQGQQVWIVDRHGSKIGATVENVSRANDRQRSDTLNRASGVAVAAVVGRGCRSQRLRLQVDALK